MQHYNEKLYLKPKAFDRWREYVRAKRAFRYYLLLVDKRSEVVKADMHWAMDKWRQFFP